MRSFAAPFLALLAALSLAAAADAAAPAVVRARYGAPAGTGKPGSSPVGGTLFFLKLASGPVAVGAAHSFDLGRLAASPELVFELARTRRTVARASRLLTAPGIAFSAPGGTIRDDLIVFALDTPPDGVAVLEPGEPARVGDRVRLLGVPTAVPRDEDDLFGRVRERDDGRLEIELDVAYDLRGWGGAPVLSASDGRAVGVLEAAWPSGTTLRVAAAPIEAVLEAVAQPLDGGRGRAFARFAPTPGEATAAASSPTAATPPAEPKTAASARSAPPAASRGTPGAAKATPAASKTAPAPSTAASRAASAHPAPPRDPTLRSVSQAPSEGGPLLSRKEVATEKRKLFVEIDHPSNDAIVGSAQGAFVAGRALAPRGEVRHIDVMMVLDTSGSTADASGADINGNGIVGEQREMALGTLLGLGKNDPGDSILAAEVAAARRLLARLDPRSTRVGLITFAGEPASAGFFAGRPPAPALTEVALTSDYRDVQRGLDRILERGPEGLTHMAAGVDQATIELRGLRGAYSRADPTSEKIVLFLTDGQPTLPCRSDDDSAYWSGVCGMNPQTANVRAVLRAAERGRKAGLRFFTFGIGEEALSGPLAIVRLAEITGGSFTPVRDPARLRDVIEQVDFADIQDLTVRNLRNGAVASQVETGADGSFGALVPLEPGRNEIEATARTSDGQIAKAKVIVNYAPGAPEPPLPPALLASRNQLLELQLAELRRKRVQLEVERTEETRKQLQLEIEKERAQAQNRAETQRKSLDLRVDDRGGEEPAPPKSP